MRSDLIAHAFIRVVNESQHATAEADKQNRNCVNYAAAISGKAIIASDRKKYLPTPLLEQGHYHA
jgi:hypothetical protein